MTNKTNKANNVRVLRPSWRAAGEAGAQAQARRVREQSEHTPLIEMDLRNCCTSA